MKRQAMNCPLSSQSLFYWIAGFPPGGGRGGVLDYTVYKHCCSSTPSACVPTPGVGNTLITPIRSTLARIRANLFFSSLVLPLYPVRSNRSLTGRLGLIFRMGIPIHSSSSRARARNFKRACARFLRDS